VSIDNAGELPEEFSELEKWCNQWCLPGTAARNNQRYASSFDEIESFYDAMMARADEALEYMSALQLGTLTRKQENLLLLLLSLAEVGPAVEWYGSAEVDDGYDPKKVPLTIELSESEAQ